MLVTYVGDYSALDVSGIGSRFVRGVPTKAPHDWAAKMIGTDPRQWKCEDPGVIEAAKVFEEEEARAKADYEASIARAPEVIEEGMDVTKLHSAQPIESAEPGADAEVQDTCLDSEQKPTSL